MSYANESAPEAGARPNEGTDDVCQRPEVKPLVDKSGATSLRETPAGKVITGAGTPGGGAAKPLDLDTPHKPGAGAPSGVDKG